MQLLYVWIKNYKNIIVDQEFNFGSEFNFSYDKNKKELIFENNSNYIQNFFGNNISNVTAIIGKNGSGKSTLLELIIENLASFDSGSGATSWGRLIDIFILDKYIIHLPSVIINNEIEINSKGFELCPVLNFEDNLDYMETFKQKGVLNYEYPQQYPIFIYYDNSLETRLSEYGYFNLLNISTIELLINSKNNDSRYFNIPIDSYNVFFDNEIKRQAIFLSEFQFKLPFINLLSLIIEIEQDNSTIEYKDINSSFMIDEVLKKNDIYSNKIKYFFTYQLSKVILKYKEQYQIDIDWQNENIELQKQIKAMYFENLIEDNENNTKFNEEIIKPINTLLEYIKSIIKDNIVEKLSNKDFELIIEKKLVHNFWESFNCFYIDFKDIKEFLDNYRLAVKDVNFLKFSWDYSLSTGEKAYLNLLSRFYCIKNDSYYHYHYNKSSNIIIFIDEGETGFHSEWQRQYLKLLIETLPQIYEGKKIQIILTSHSPFVISDLPKENVIFLDTYKEGEEEGQIAGNCKVVPGIEKEQTFGANIHTLLSDGFFMEGGLMGEFAKGKILDVLKEMEDFKKDKKNPDLKTRNKWSNIINMIGEDIIRESMKDVYIKNFGLTEEEKEKRRKELQDELDKLNNLN